MQLYHFLRQESTAFTNQMVVLTCAAGLIQGILVAILIRAAGSATPDELNFQLFLFFAIGISAFIYCRRYTLFRISFVAEEVIERVRMRLADKIRRSELVDIEAQGSGRIYSTLTTDTQSISQAAGMLVNVVSSCIMVVAAMGYLFILSPVIFGLTAAFFAFVYYYFVVRQGENQRKLHLASEVERQYFDSLDDLIHGLKELKQSDRRNEEFYSDRLKKLSEQALELRTDVAQSLNRGLVLAQGLFYSLLGIIVFIIPNITPDEVDMIAPATAMVVFMIGPLGEVIGSFQIISKGIVAIVRLKELEARLDKPKSGNLDTPDAVPGDPFGEIQEIRCEACEFTYPSLNGNSGSFTLGPIDFSLKKGEIVFIVGGNGSGKSTFMRLLVGLYSPSKGRILVNNRPVTGPLRQNYRNLFGTIFTDFHLFDEMYGIDTPSPEQSTELLQQMQLVDKTRIEGRRITNRKLSTGQRKRLAMIITLLEDRPFLVFDEWAADQDPGFREYFYRDLLPHFRKAGKTLIVVSHDDRYFDTGDRCLKMEFGKFIPYEVKGNPS